MTTIDPTEIPVLSEEKANAVLEDVIHTAIQFQTEAGEEIEMSATEKLQRGFGDAAALVARLIMLGAMRGSDIGFVEATPGSDRTDILAAELRSVHTKEQFGDCVEDGEQWPCRTIRMVELVAGSIAEEPVAEGETTV